MCESEPPGTPSSIEMHRVKQDGDLKHIKEIADACQNVLPQSSGPS